MRTKRFGDRTRPLPYTRGTPRETEINLRVNWEKCRTRKSISLTTWRYSMSTARSLDPSRVFQKIHSTVIQSKSWRKRSIRHWRWIRTVSFFTRDTRRTRRISEDNRWEFPASSQFLIWVNRKMKRRRSLTSRSITTRLSWLTTATCSGTTRTKYRRWVWETTGQVTIQLFSNTTVATSREVT